MTTEGAQPEDIQKAVKDCLPQALREELPLALAEVLGPMVKHNASEVLKRYRRWAVSGFLLIVIAFGLLFADLQDQANEVRTAQNQNKERLQENRQLTLRLFHIEHPTKTEFRAGVIAALKRCVADPTCKKILFQSTHRRTVSLRHQATQTQGLKPTSGSTPKGGVFTNPPSGLQPGPVATEPPSGNRHHHGQGPGSGHGGGQGSSPQPQGHTPPVVNVNTPPAPAVCTFLVGINCPGGP